MGMIVVRVVGDQVAGLEKEQKVNLVGKRATMNLMILSLEDNRSETEIDLLLNDEASDKELEFPLFY